MSNDVANGPNTRLTVARALQCMGLLSGACYGTAGKRFSSPVSVRDSSFRGFL